MNIITFLSRGILMFAVIFYCKTQAMNVMQPIQPVYNIIPDNLTEPRIVGGFEATRHQFPYQVAMLMNGRSFCGGSLISNDTVLTAAHCIKGYNKFEVHIAAHNYHQYNEIDRQIVKTTSAVYHENYSGSTIVNDIALVFLPKAVSGIGVGIIRLPTNEQKNETFVGETGVVSGWGSTSGSGSIPSVLRYVHVPVISNTECKKMYISILKSTMICTDSLTNTKGSCSGDSGGPLAITDIDGKPTLIGIVSFGLEDCRGHSVYTRVTSYLDWINATSANKSSVSNVSNVSNHGVSVCVILLLYHVLLVSSIV